MRWLQTLRRSRAETDSVLRRINVKGVALKVYDYRSSSATQVVKNELETDCYGVERIRFAPGDVVIDVGGHVGIFSNYLAKRYPFLHIYAFEPLPQNYEHFRRNLAANGIANVEVFNRAITGDGRPVEMIVHHSNTGGATAQLKDMRLPEHANYVAQSVTLDDVFDTHRIERCKLLKIDCEGSEHEILLNAKCLDRVEYLSGEFHINAHLQGQGYSIEGLAAHCRKYVSPDRIFYTACHMAE